MSPNPTRLVGRTALVTGSTGGLGAVFATALAEQGAFVIVIVTGRDAAGGRRLVGGVNYRPGKHVITVMGQGDG